MGEGKASRTTYVTGMAVLLFLLVCMLVVSPLGAAVMTGGEPRASARTEPGDPAPAGECAATDDWSLWTRGTLLRGANIYQRRVYPELDGLEFLGPGPVGPPYTQEDLDGLAAMGANYVQVSHPGLFNENPPYGLDEDIQGNLDRLLDMVSRAGMRAVIAFRTGPGRSEFTFLWEGVETWFDESYLNDTVWELRDAQDAWVAMWRYTAQRYKDHPAVAGYELMVEPNANDRLLDIWDPGEFHRDYAGTTYDWNQLFPRITAAVREVDPDTPILVGGAGYSAVSWLPYVRPSGDGRTVYVVHQYEPHLYTHQEPPDPRLTYPGTFDADYDGVEEAVDRAWLEGLLATVDEFKAVHGVPVAATEYGPMRWEPGAARFMDDLMGLFEERGMNYALWVWHPAWEPWNEGNDDFDFRHGPDPENHADLATSDLLEVIKGYWARNDLGPPLATRYFAAGYTGAGFHVYLLLMNQGDRDERVWITYMFNDGSTREQRLTVPARSRATVYVNTCVGEGRKFSCQVDAGGQVLAERSTYFNYHAY